jgi:hypothetical protein
MSDRLVFGQGLGIQNLKFLLSGVVHRQGLCPRTPRIF